MPNIMVLATLPTDILILVLECLGFRELVALSSTCHKLSNMVSEFGWVGYLRSNPRPSYSLSSSRPKWSPRRRVQYDYLTDSAWEKSEFVARPLSRPWQGKLQPTLAISPSRLVVTAGSTLYSYKFGDLDEGLSPSVQLEGAFSFVEPHEPSRNITGVTFVRDGELDRTLYVSFQDGAIERVVLMVSELNGKTAMSVTRTAVPPFPNYDFVESLSCNNDALLSLSSTGLARLESLSAHDKSSSSSIIELKSRSWVSLLSLNSSTPYAAFGTSSTTPVAIHPITSSQLSAAPSAILHTNKSATRHADRLTSTAVYGLSHAPLSSPWGSSPEIVVTGWFDGLVRCYDLRSSTRASLETTQNAGPTPLRPVLELSDKWSEEPIYSVSCGGGAASHIAAGTARHSLVSFWDVRSPLNGWKVYAPGNDSSPVYSVILESSRFFGATQSRPFVYDFGPGLTANTYPPIPQVRGMDGLKQRKNSLSYTVLVLPHSH